MVNTLLSLFVLATASLVKGTIVAGAPYELQILDSASGAGNCITASSNADGAPVTIAPCTRASSQQWIVDQGAPDSGAGAVGTIKIFGNKCLDATNGVNADGTKLQIWTCATGNTNQAWQVTSGTGSSSIAWANKGKCVDLTNGVKTSGNQLQVWTCVGNNNQKWVPIPLSRPPPTRAVQFQAHVPNSSTRAPCLTASGNSNGSPVVVQECSNAPSDAWTVQDGSLKIFGGMCLDVTNGANQDGTFLQIWQCVDGNTNQDWNVNADGTIVWNGKNKCVDLTNGNLTPGNKIQVWTCFAGNTNQQWKQVPVVVR